MRTLLPAFLPVTYAVIIASSTCDLTMHVTDFVTWTTTTCGMPCEPPSSSKAGDTLWMNYNGSLTDGTLFDSSYSEEKPWPSGDPFSFGLGEGDVIVGFDAGLYEMCAGERRTLEIPPEYGYGEKGVEGIIPPNSTLVFDVELMGIGETLG